MIGSASICFADSTKENPTATDDCAGLTLAASAAKRLVQITSENVNTLGMRSSDETSHVPIRVLCVTGTRHIGAWTARGPFTLKRPDPIDQRAPAAPCFRILPGPVLAFSMLAKLSRSV